MSISKGPFYICLLLVSLLTLMLVACGSAAPAGEEAFEAIDLNGEDLADEPPPVEDVAVQENGELVPCPGPGTSMVLKFSANITINYESASITHTLDDGLLSLVINKDNNIESLEKPALSYTMNGIMDECTMEGGGEMRPSAFGYCKEGVVYLNITEEWGPYEGTMTCPDGAMPLNFPAPGAQIHQGADGLGEAFPLDAGFAEEGAGFISMRPFAGPGTGDHTWTLFIDALQPVPIVP